MNKDQNEWCIMCEVTGDRKAKSNFIDDITKKWSLSNYNKFCQGFTNHNLLSILRLF